MKEKVIFTKASLVEDIHSKMNKNKSEVRDLVEEMLELMKSAIKKDHSLMLTGFGKFEAVSKPIRLGRNPKTSEVLTLPACKVVGFRISRKFKDELNK